MEWEAALSLLNSILAKRGIAAELKKLRELMQWAQRKGHLEEVPLPLSPEEWTEIGNLLWVATIEGGKDCKAVRDLGVIREPGCIFSPPSPINTTRSFYSASC